MKREYKKILEFIWLSPLYLLMGSIWIAGCIILGFGSLLCKAVRSAK